MPKSEKPHNKYKQIKTAIYQKVAKDTTSLEPIAENRFDSSFTNSSEKTPSSIGQSQIFDKR